MPANDDRDRLSVLADLYPDSGRELDDIIAELFRPVRRPDEPTNSDRKRAREEWEEKRRQRRA